MAIKTLDSYDALDRALWVRNGFDTDAKLALRARVLDRIHEDAGLWSALWPLTDAYGPQGFLPPDGYDWSGFRDSTYGAIAAMAARLGQGAEAFDLPAGQYYRVACGGCGVAYRDNDRLAKPTTCGNCGRSPVTLSVEEVA